MRSSASRSLQHWSGRGLLSTSSPRFFSGPGGLGGLFYTSSVRRTKYSEPEELLRLMQENYPTYDPNFAKNFQVAKLLAALESFEDDPKKFGEFRESPEGKKFMDKWVQDYNENIYELGKAGSMERPGTRRLDRE